jgi:hypothetical protein
LVVPVTAEQVQIASLIDEQVKRVFRKGGDEVAVLMELFDYMPGFKYLLDTARPGDMDQLCERFDGFYRYAKILEDVAAGIQSGEIKVPK